MLDLCIRSGNCIQRGGDHQLEVALGEHNVGVLPVQHLALLSKAKLAGEAVNGLGEDGAVRGASAASDCATAAVEEAQTDVALARDLVQGAMGLVDLPCARN